MKLSYEVWAVILVGFLVGCASVHKSRFIITTNERGEKVVIGRIKSEELLRHFPEYRRNYLNYYPDSSAVRFLQSWSPPVKILLFIGTWCSDCRREVPKLFKTLDMAKNSQIKLDIVAIDRGKRDAENLMGKYGIRYVPTFVILYRQREVGRIVEHAKVSIEQDLVTILKQIQ